MEFSIKTDELLKGLYRAQGIVERKTAMPILSNVLFKATEDGKLSITATDLEVGMTGQHEAEVLTPGLITISARHLYDIVRSLPKESISIKKLENHWAEIRCGKIEYRMLGMAAEDFQGLPDVSKAKCFEVEANVLKSMIEKTIYAVSNDETRYNLNGSYLEKLGEQGFRMVATDGHRLSMIDASLAIDPKQADFSNGVIIPKKGLMEIKRLLDVEQGGCQLGLDGNNLVFTLNGVTVVMRLLDGKFPDYRQVVPQKQKILLNFDKKVLTDCLRRISILSAMSSDKTLGIKFVLKKGLLQVNTNNPDLGEAKEDIETGYDGNEITIGFNARYILDALGSIDSEKVEVYLEDDLSPGVFKPIDNANYTCVVMPMRI